MDIVATVRKFVEDECKKPTSKYGYEPFEHHFVPMVGHALGLADELGGDKEIIAIAAWLHDIGSIIYSRDDHHITGAKIAEKKLIELKYPANKIETVKRSILNHRGSRHDDKETLEEKIIAEADAMSNFDNLAGIFKAAYVYENMTQNQAKLAAKKKLQNKFKQLQFEKSKEIIRPKFDAAMLLLS